MTTRTDTDHDATVATDPDAARAALDGLDADGKAVRRPTGPDHAPAPPAAGAIDRANPPGPNEAPPGKEGTGTPHLKRVPPSEGQPGANK